MLLDSHVVLWSVETPAKLSPSADNALQDPNNDLLVSVATIWEIAIKVGLGKLALSPSYRTWMDLTLAGLGATVLPITVGSAEIISTLPHHHRDPFDRLIIAQALLEGVVIVSADAQFDDYGVNRLW